jgi:hypothetical protein
MKIDMKEDKTVWMHNLAVQFDKELEKKEAEEKVKKQRKGAKNEAGRMIAKLKKEVEDHKKISEAFKDSTLGVGPDVSKEWPGLTAAEIRRVAEIEVDIARWKKVKESAKGPIKVEYQAPFELKIDDQRVHYSPPWEGFVLLGSVVTGDGCTQKDLERRLGKAWKGFFGLRKVFMNEMVDPKIRIKALDTLIRPILMYGCESWAPTKADLERMKTCHLSMARIICGVKPQTDVEEKYHEAMIRVTHRIKNILRSLKADEWNFYCMRRIHRWGGHVARMETYAPSKLAYQSLRWRDGLYIDEKRMQSYDGRHLHRGHSRKVWRWEGELHKAYKERGMTWHRLAQDREQWAKEEGGWAWWRMITQVW